ncbi:MAG: FMN-binding protein [Myxococcales bacterium]|nr:FMN-binding protein [Myxococcales bacterium]
MRDLSRIILVVSLVTSGWLGTAEAKIFHSRESALKVAFPGAERIEHRNVFLTPKQVEAVKRMSQAPLQTSLVRVYVAFKHGKVFAYGFIDTHVVRTLPETFITVVGIDGAVLGVHLLAFQEPLEYMPAKRWLGQFRGKHLKPSLRIRYDISGIAGATLSALSVTRGVRRVLALYRVIFGRK